MLRHARGQRAIGGIVAKAGEVEHGLLLLTIARQEPFDDGGPLGAVFLSGEEVQGLDQRPRLVGHADGQQIKAVAGTTQLTDFFQPPGLHFE